MQTYSCIFRTLHIQNQKHIQNSSLMRTRGMFRTLACWVPKAHSELCQASAMEHFAKIVNGYKYFRKSYDYFRDISFFSFSTLWNKYFWGIKIYIYYFQFKVCLKTNVYENSTFTFNIHLLSFEAWFAFFIARFIITSVIEPIDRYLGRFPTKYSVVN